jgi:hypothetical protein
MLFLPLVNLDATIRLLDANFKKEKVQKEHKLMSSCALLGFRPFQITLLESVVGTTGLEPASSAVTAESRRHRTTPLAPSGTNRKSYCTLNKPTTSVQMTSAFLPRLPGESRVPLRLHAVTAFRDNRDSQSDDAARSASDLRLLVIRDR